MKLQFQKRNKDIASGGFICFTAETFSNKIKLIILFNKINSET